MSAAYIVLATNNFAEVEVCEAYASRDLAVGRAVELAQQAGYHSDWIETDPYEVELDNGTICMRVYESETHYIGVHFDKVRTQLNTKTDPLMPVSYYDALSGKPLTVINKVEASLLPGGWDIDGNPVNEQFVRDFPHDVVPTSELTENQRLALTIARIRKQPQYRYVSAYSITDTFDQEDALIELAPHHITDLGREIMENECADLDNLREDAMLDDASEDSKNVYDDESSEYEEDDSWT